MSSLKPLLHWAGGKRQLLPELISRKPEKFGRYYEPFLGAGALLFALAPKRATVNDTNEELVNLYRIIRQNPDELIQVLEGYASDNNFGGREDTFNRLRNMDRADNWDQVPPVIRAARTIYLNRMCFNGLYRVNSKGQFNTPIGTKQKFTVEAETIRAIGQYLKKNDVTIFEEDFVKGIKSSRPGDFVYFDPPYYPASETANFTSYTSDGFNRDDQVRLRDWMIDLTRRGVFVMLTNSDTGFVRELYRYKCFEIAEVQARRSINSAGNKRGPVGELIITNYPRGNSNGEIYQVDK
jgi:DNA adenine methylase